MAVAKNSTVAVLICFFVASVFATEVEPPNGFRSIKWGTPPAGELKKLTGPTADGTSLYVPTATGKLRPLFGIPVTEEAYSYTNGKFFSGTAWLDGQSNLERMKVALSKTYGPPSFTNEKLYIWIWKWPAKQIEVRLTYQAKFFRTSLSVTNDGI